VKKFLTDEKQYETYLFLVLSLVTVVLGILLLCDVLSISEKSGIIGKYPDAFAAILVVIGIGGIIYSIIGIRKNVKYLRDSVFYKVIKMDKEEIKKKFVMCDANKVVVYKGGNNIDIQLFYGKVYYEFNIGVKQTSLCLDYNEELADNLSDEEIEEIDNAFEYEDLDSTKVNVNELFNYMIKFINIY
jgi:hypothetical protein